ncbi:hypothetical protein LR48_Vigan11g068100 [Vigna angularis]|uniref:Uncharacterized protein n=1 Tax=Phaseolus angularis TaxID=3914 RepID=A0A0L9VRS2_PHAAN|nr:hypothetical protein LR48_Vigan11g068100 [Vigna angularis]
MTSSSGKRVKTIGHKRKEKEHIYSNKFLTAAHEKYFPRVDGRRLLMERKVAIIPSLAPQLERELDRSNWRTLVLPILLWSKNFIQIHGQWKDFATRVAWPVAPSQTDGGVGAAEASAMEEDTEDEEEDEEDSDDYN